MLDFLTLAQECAPTVAPQTLAAIVNVESSYNPYAIGVVNGRLKRQPKNKTEAVATAKRLAADGWNFSMGIAQVNRYNLPKYNITYEQAFEPCSNLKTGSAILVDCYQRAAQNGKPPQQALQAAISCYYSGNFVRGFKPDFKGQPSYVEKVLASAEAAIQPVPIVPAIETQKSLTKRDNPPPQPQTSGTQQANGLDPVVLQPVKQNPATNRKEPKPTGENEEEEKLDIVF